MTLKDFAQQLNRKYGQPIMYVISDVDKYEAEKALCRKAQTVNELNEAVKQLQEDFDKLMTLILKGFKGE